MEALTVVPQAENLGLKPVASRRSPEARKSNFDSGLRRVVDDVQDGDGDGDTLDEVKLLAAQDLGKKVSVGRKNGIKMNAYLERGKFKYSVDIGAAARRLPDEPGTTQAARGKLKTSVDIGAAARRLRTELDNTQVETNHGTRRIERVDGGLPAGGRKLLKKCVKMASMDERNASSPVL
ncbi:hypothetical protein DFH06DRAFT_1125791 [Mycena polygramma]|nr:hypothetical protein DFH06DRAFT_1125789 [Mycena polygramma]KAJ7669434.1 hypothetical protein DFH06DRAFT_1125791 [Mycena polygramma]